jgi:MFS family permease
MPLADEGSARGADAHDIAPYPKIMGGDFDLAGVQAPPGLSWRHIEKLLVARQAGQQAAWIFAAIGLTAMIVQGGLIGFIKKRLGEVNMVLAGTLLMTLSLALIPLPKLFYGEFPIMALLAVGNSIAMPVLAALISELSPEAERGEIMGVSQSVQSLGRIIGPIAGGQLFNYLSPNAPYWAGAAVMFLCFLIALKLRGTHPLPTEPHTATHAVTAET